MGGGGGMQANSETVRKSSTSICTALSISRKCVLLLEIFGGVVRQRTIAGTKNSVGTVLRVVFHLEDRSGFLYFLKIKPSNQRCF